MCVYFVPIWHSIEVLIGYSAFEIFDLTQCQSDFPPSTWQVLHSTPFSSFRIYIAATATKLLLLYRSRTMKCHLCFQESRNGLGSSAASSCVASSRTDVLQRPAAKKSRAFRPSLNFSSLKASLASKRSAQLLLVSGRSDSALPE